MVAHNELSVRARVVGLDPTTYSNDSKLEQKVLFLEKNATTFTGSLATGVLTSDNTNNADADTVTVGSQVYTYKTALTGAFASATLTSDATAPSDGDTVTLDGVTYTFRTALTVPARPYEVLIGVSAAVALDNIKQAVNQGDTVQPAAATNEGSGTNWSTGTRRHPSVNATTNANTTQLFVANLHGSSQNAKVSVEVSSHLSFGAANFAGGVDRVNGEVFIGTDADTSLTNLRSAINGTGTADTDYSGKTPVNASVTAGAVTAHAITLTAKDYSVTNASVATTETGAHLSFGATTLASGVAKVVAVDGTTVNGSAGLSGDKNV
jgi:hypothetical protein